MNYGMGYYIKPLVRQQRHNNPRQRQPTPAHRHQNIERPKPPSHSIAPWDITRWVDPIHTTQVGKGLI
ncbi:unnamed protein product [Adineta ricciae]|uniref:Uncharacterized protein n=1 Tax=Adineta ricciae TaxID=249248 RepID=A0A815ZHC2_ADIRI|nr:unnamed protein product [Adineta ricciae]CAF1585133.1 unnamed protein product [Adineta ricciae]